MAARPVWRRGRAERGARLSSLSSLSSSFCAAVATTAMSRWWAASAHRSAVLAAASTAPGSWLRWLAASICRAGGTSEPPLARCNKTLFSKRVLNQ